jgi:glutathione reductase (NADPH)
MTFDYDLFVIGAGSGGLAASKRAASYGAKVAIAESDLVGGTCVIRGCVPKKLMVYASQFAHWYDDATGYGWEPVAPGHDWSTLIDRVQAEVMRLNKLHIRFLEEAGVELISGLGRFVDAHTVEIVSPEGNRQVTARYILIAVGAEAVRPDIPGIEHSITSREMFLLPKRPERFVVLGGGYIGVEFAGILKGLGSQVTQVLRGDRILRGFDSDIRDQVQQAMGDRGIAIHTHADIASMRIDKTDSGLVMRFKTADGKAHELLADVILSATGRKPKPQIEPLNLDNAGVKVVNGAIAVTVDHCTNQPHIYAVGDCTDRVNLTPVAIAEGRAFADTVFGHQPRTISHRNIPSAVFSQPEAATVGMTEEEARAAYGDRVKVYRSRFRPMIYSLTDCTEKVLVKLVVEGENERVLGVHMVGKDAAEIIQGMAIPVVMGATKADFDRTIAIHPSTAEEFVTLR